MRPVRDARGGSLRSPPLGAGDLQSSERAVPNTDAARVPRAGRAGRYKGDGEAPRDRFATEARPGTRLSLSEDERGDAGEAQPVDVRRVLVIVVAVIGVALRGRDPAQRR